MPQSWHAASSDARHGWRACPRSARTSGGGATRCGRPRPPQRGEEASMGDDAAFAPLAADRWAGSPVRYPDPAVRVLDPRFERYRIDSAAVERLATGFRWVEGPVWFGDHRCLLFSDIPNDRILRWDEQTAALSVFRAPSDFANG